MRAYLRSVRIAPKKASVIAQMIRGLTVDDAVTSLERTNKKGARIVLALLKSAVANATHNDKQRPEELVIRSIVVNQAQSYRRGVSMARGRIRPMRKFLSHIEIVLGVGEIESEGEGKTKSTKSTKSTRSTKSTKSEEKPSRSRKSEVKQKHSKSKTDSESSSSLPSS